MTKPVDIKRILKRLAVEIRSARERRERREPGEWTQAKLAVKLGHQQQSIQGYEKGKNFPQGEILFLLAHYLELSLDEILHSRPRSRPPEYEQKRRLLREIFEDKEEVIEELRVNGKARVHPTTAEDILKKAGIIVKFDINKKKKPGGRK